MALCYLRMYTVYSIRVYTRYIMQNVHYQHDAEIVSRSLLQIYFLTWQHKTIRVTYMQMYITAFYKLEMI